MSVYYVITGKASKALLLVENGRSVLTKEHLKKPTLPSPSF